MEINSKDDFLLNLVFFFIVGFIKIEILFLQNFLFKNTFFFRNVTNGNENYIKL